MINETTVGLLLDRLRRQAVDVVGPVLALIAAGQVAGVDFPSVLSVLIGGAAVTVLTWLVGLSPSRWWERLLVTAAGSLVGVIGTDTSGWLSLDWTAVLIAVAGSVALSLLRSWSTDVR